MKLVLRRIKPGDPVSPYCLQTEDGEVIPCQLEVTVKQKVEELTRVIVEFVVDDLSLRIESSNG